MMEVVVIAGAIGRAKLQSNHYHQQTSTKSRDTGIRGLMRGMANLPKVTRTY